MRRRIFGLALVFSVFLMSVVGISNSDAASLKNSIVGKWIRVEGYALGKQVEFLKDGTFIDGETAGDYRFIDDNRLRMDARGMAMVFNVLMDKDGALNLKGNDGVAGRFITEKAWVKKQEVAKLNLPGSWSISVVPTLSGIIEGDYDYHTRQFSTLDFFDNSGRARVKAVAYKTQYFSRDLLNGVEGLKARTALSLFNAPEGVAGSHRTMILEPGSRVMIIEAYSEIKQPMVFTALKDTHMSLPGEEILAIPKGSITVPIDYPGGECASFISTSFVGFRTLCPSDSEESFKIQEGSARTAYLVETAFGKRAWTRFYPDKPDSEELKDWIFCVREYSNDKLEKFSCNE